MWSLGLQEPEGRSEQASEGETSEKHQRLKSEEAVSTNPRQRTSEGTDLHVEVAELVHKPRITKLGHIRVLAINQPSHVGHVSRRSGESPAKHVQICPLICLFWKMVRVRTTSLHLLLCVWVKQVKEGDLDLLVPVSVSEAANIPPGFWSDLTHCCGLVA